MLIFGNQKTDLKVLESDLKNFGLNPKDWKVVREPANSYRVQSVEDYSFVFRGQVRRNGSKLAWRKLELASI